ncbi:MAG: asparaginase [Candidatus Fermentibacteria bacterium]|nr:asparaginase [Candidatus Fermentibacteria bacterium]
MKKVLILSTGGTIEMQQKGGGFSLSSTAAIDISSLDSMSDITIVLRKYLNLPSPHITPEIMVDIAEELRKIEISGEFDGVVVTHGTDTLEETAFMADIHLEGVLPVAFTAAMRSSSELGVDGPRNIRSAVRVVCTKTDNPGVTVVLNDEIHAAGRVTKTCTSNVSSFDSPGYGPLGFVDDDRVIFHRLPIWRMNLPPGPLVLEKKVGLVRVAAGYGHDLIDFLTGSNYKGIIVQAFGRGNVHPDTADAIERAIDSGVVVIITSRCHEGRVLGVYSYPGGGVDLRKRGVLFAGDMSGCKIRLLLMACLGRKMKKDQIGKMLSSL